MQDGKTIPYSIEAEQSVLGSILLEKDLLIMVADQLRKEDFYAEQNAEVYDAMLTLFRKQEPIDLVTLTELLRNRGLFERAGGIQYLTNLATAPDFSENIMAYAKIVKDKSILRQLINASNETIQNCYNTELDIEYVLEKAETVKQ